ncbi:hypothetical protein [Thiocystis violacea]|uniref:hypothetical protein n=1 Tax=Thiocystis violacea TaxID=13725 RepID=UPI001906C7C7|nr:hypothetical protein [Thiocystis violacea]MBK1719001.1 hypothetical protein [Thiocystis violacea]
MKLLANFVMRGYSQATLVTTVAGLLSLLLPFIGILSSAAVGLVTLRKGQREGLLLLIFATLAASLIALLALGNAWVGVGLLVILWVPIWGLANILRSTRSLATTVQLAALGGLVMVLVIHVAVGDPALYWRQLMEPLRLSLVGDGLFDADASEVLFGQLAKWMTGAFAAALVFQYLVSLFIARWWQAHLYNPGGFGDEFRAMRLRPVVGILFLVLLGWGLLAKGIGLDLAPVLGFLLLLQGLTVVHGLRGLLAVHRGWLVALYLLLVLFMPQTGLLLASIGLVDLWADIRARVAQRVSGQR